MIIIKLKYRCMHSEWTISIYVKNKLKSMWSQMNQTWLRDFKKNTYETSTHTSVSSCTHTHTHTPFSLILVIVQHAKNTSLIMVCFFSKILIWLFPKLLFSRTTGLCTFNLIEYHLDSRPKHLFLRDY